MDKGISFKTGESVSGFYLKDSDNLEYIATNNLQDLCRIISGSRLRGSDYLTADGIELFDKDIVSRELRCEGSPIFQGIVVYVENCWRISNGVKSILLFDEMSPTYRIGSLVETPSLAKEFIVGTSQFRVRITSTVNIDALYSKDTNGNNFVLVPKSNPSLKEIMKAFEEDSSSKQTSRFKDVKLEDLSEEELISLEVTKIEKTVTIPVYDLLDLHERLKDTGGCDDYDQVCTQLIKADFLEALIEVYVKGHKDKELDLYY